jgi:hypothetical protein
MAQVKGSNLLGAVKFLRRHRDAARAELAPALHPYLEGRVLQTEWYPEADLVELLRVIAKLIGNASPDAFELMGRATLQMHLAGVYERLLKGDSTSLGRRIAAIWQTQHDTGRFTFQSTARGRGIGDLADFGHPSREMCAIISGYLHEALTSADFRDARVTKLGCVLDGEKTCRWECSWAEPG